MTDAHDAATHLRGRVVVITGAGGGFGKLIAELAAARGARVVVSDIDEAGDAERADILGRRVVQLYKAFPRGDLRFKMHQVI